MGTVHRLLALAGVAVIVLAGLCLLDTDHQAAGDLCLPLLTMVTSPVLASPLTATGVCSPALATAYRLDLRDLPAPPPKA